MQCSQCGGLVTWRGPLSALTHTECGQCGAQNSQVVEPEPCSMCAGLGEVGGFEGGAAPGWATEECPNCYGEGVEP